MYRPADRKLRVVHNFLLAAARTEKRMPVVRNFGTVTVWPEVAAERNVDFRPDKTFVTFCQATNRQIDDHALAEELINLLDENERLLVRKVLKALAIDGRRVPPWKDLAKDYRCDRRTVTRRYEKALFEMLYRDLKRNRCLAKMYRLA